MNTPRPGNWSLRQTVISLIAGFVGAGIAGGGTVYVVYQLGGASRASAHVSSPPTAAPTPASLARRATPLLTATAAPTSAPLPTRAPATKPPVDPTAPPRTPEPTRSATPEPTAIPTLPPGAAFVYTLNAALPENPKATFDMGNLTIPAGMHLDRVLMASTQNPPDSALNGQFLWTINAIGVPIQIADMDGLGWPYPGFPDQIGFDSSPTIANLTGTYDLQLEVDSIAPTYGVPSGVVMFLIYLAPN